LKTRVVGGIQTMRMQQAERVFPRPTLKITKLLRNTLRQRIIAIIGNVAN